MSIVRVTDLTDTQRSCIVDTADVAPVVGQWLAADGATSVLDKSALSPNVAHLARALAAANWTAVHAIASHLSMDVEVLLP
jgi:hypothetical protein